MPKIPDTLGGRNIPSTPNRVKSYDAAAPYRVDLSPAQQAARAYGDSQQKMIRVNQQAADNMMDAADDIARREERDAILEAQRRENDAQRKLLDVLYGSDEQEGLYNRRGADSFGVEKSFKESYERIRNEALDGVHHPAAQKALEKSLESMALGNLGNVKRYTASERRDYAATQAATHAELARERVGMEYNNDATFREALLQAEASAVATARIKGETDPDALELAARKAQAEIYGARFSAMVATDDPAQILQAFDYYEKARESGDLDFDTVQRFDNAFDAVLPKAQAHKEFQKFQQGAAINDSDTDTIFNAMLGVESGNKHYDASGKVITSPAGARGKAQLMEKTAKEMARKLGIAESAWLDPEVNEALGRAYYREMAMKFNDMTLATLAYNWGPTNVTKHLEKMGDPRKGEVSYDYFLASIPSKEARQYVPKVQGRLGQGMGSGGMFDLASAQAYATRLDPRVQPEFTKLVENQAAAGLAERQLQTKSVMDEALQSMQQGGGFTAIPAPLRARAHEVGILGALQDYSGATKAETASFLYSLPPEELKKLDLNTPGIRLGLSPADYEKWTVKQKTLDSAAMMVTEDARSRMIREAAMKRDIKINTDKGKERMLRLNELLDVEMDAFTQQNNGRSPAPADVQQMIDGLFLKGRIDTSPGTAWNPLNWGGKVNYAFDITVDDIPKKIRREIAAELEARGIAPVDAEIIRRYISGLE